MTQDMTRAEAAPAAPAAAPARPRGPRFSERLDLSRLDPPPKVRPLRGTVSSVTWSRPGRLNAASQEYLIGVLTRVCNHTFGVDYTRYWEYRHAAGCFASLNHLELLLTPDDEIVGFTSYRRARLAGERCVFIDSTAVLPRFQTHGLMSPIFARNFVREHLRAPLGRLHMIVRTENPVVYVALAQMLGRESMWPSAERPTPPEIQAVGTATAEWLGQAGSFDAEKLRVLDAYPELDCLYQTLPKCGDPAVDQLFAEYLRPQDALYVTAPARWSSLLPFWRKQQSRTRQIRRDLRGASSTSPTVSV